MKNRELENKISRAYAGVTPDVLSSVLSKTEKHIERSTMQTTKKKSRLIPIMGIAAAVALIITGVLGFGGFLSGSIDTVVTLDVNPGIEINLDRNEKVISVVPLNEDGKTVVGTMNFEGSEIEVAVNALIGSMLRHGYIDNLANSILVSVEGKDSQKSLELSKRLSKDIEELLVDSAPGGGSVLSQVVEDKSDIKSLSDKYGITMGKAQLVIDLVNAKPSYSADDLAKLSINELNLLASAGKADLAATTVGQASREAYITHEQAKEYALKDAGLSASDASWISTQLDFDDGRMIYEVGIYVDGAKREYEIDALSGTVLKREFDRDDDDLPPQVVVPDNGISQNDAKAKALAHVGVSESQISQYSIRYDFEDGVAHYAVEFRFGDYVYEVDVNVATGSIMEVDRDYEPRRSPEGQSSGSYIGTEAAKKAAFARAGVKASDVRRCEAELDRENGRVVYEIEFHVGRYEYSVEIDAVSGNVVSYEREIDD